MDDISRALPVPGQYFAVYVPHETQLDDIRKRLREGFNLSCLIKQKIGPCTKFSEDGEDWIKVPVEAIGDQAIDSIFLIDPRGIQPNWCVYIGLFKEDVLEARPGLT